MSWQRIPSLFRIPEVPTISTPVTGAIWRGAGADEGLFAVYNSTWGGHFIVRAEDLCFSLKIGSSVLKPVFSDVNGYIHWSGNGYVYYTLTCGWVWCDVFPGYEPLESYEFKAEGVKWSGDSFYSLSGPPYGPGSTVQMTPRGSNRESGGAKELSAVWPRWVAKSGEFGVYEGKDGREGEKIKGLPRFQGAGEYFIRSLEKENGHYRYGRIRNVGGKWVIGEVGSNAGWHEGSEPSKDGSVTFRFTKPEGSDADGSDISVSLRDYVRGDETASAYLGSVALWR